MATSGRPLRLAVVSYLLPVPGQRRGGIERVAHELANGLARRGHEVVVWSHDPAPPAAAYRVEMLPWRRFVNTWFGRRATMGYLGNLLAVLPRFGDVDAIVALGDSLLLPLRGRPVVRIMCGSALAEALTASSPWRFFLQTGVFLQELLTAAMQSACVGISANTVNWNPLVNTWIPLGVDLTTFTPDHSAKTTHPSIMFVGALGGRKRGQMLLDWFASRIRPVHPSAELHMVCSPGPAMPGVTYHTGKTNDDLAQLYRRAWVYASSSRYEGFGLPYLEAMASGTPVLATPNPGSREVLADGRFGILATDARFPHELNRLLGGESLRREWAERGLARARELDLNRTVERYEQLLYQLCQPSSKRP